MTDVLLTLDIDWAPDFAIDLVAELLVERNVPATWFVTHRSPAVARLAEHGRLFELGIHPNFLPGSSHGVSPEEVLGYCMKLVPDAVSMRSHTLVQSSGLLETVLRTTPILADVSVFLPRASNVMPVTFSLNGRGLVRIPYVWEDDYERRQPAPDWRPDPLLEKSGIVIFNFHPLHVFLNSSDGTSYEQAKCRAEGKLGALELDDARELVSNREGARTMLDRLLPIISAATGGKRIRDFVAVGDADV